MRAIRDHGGVADALQIDLADHDTAEAKVSKWIDSRPHQRLGLVLAAAILGPVGPLRETDLNGWADAFAVNVLGNLAVARALLGRMLESGYGRIVFFAGGGAGYAYPILPAYACTKTAVVRAVENLHEDLKGKGDFAVVALAPGAVDTDTLRQVRAAGGEVRTTAPVEAAISFIQTYMSGDSTDSFGPPFIHVRDSWRNVLDGSLALADDDWKLRRVE